MSSIVTRQGRMLIGTPDGKFLEVTNLNAFELEARVNSYTEELKQKLNLPLGLSPKLNRKQRRARMKGM